MAMQDVEAGKVNCIASNAMSKTTGDTDFQAFVSGFLMSLSAAEILAGVIIAGKKLLRR